MAGRGGAFFFFHPAAAAWGGLIFHPASTIQFTLYLLEQFLFLDCHWHRKANKKNTALIFACLHISSIVHNHTIPIKALANGLTVTEKDIKRAVQHVEKHIFANPPPTIEDHLTRLCNLLNGYICNECALGMVSIMRKKGVGMRAKPLCLAAVIFWICSQIRPKIPRKLLDVYLLVQYSVPRKCLVKTYMKLLPHLGILLQSDVLDRGWMQKLRSP